jgi:hypothetical protein
MKVFCPYENLQLETTHMKNCSSGHAQLVLIVLITLTKRRGKKKSSVKAHLPVVMHIRHVPMRERSRVIGLPDKALCSTLLSAVYYVVIVMVSQRTFF